MHMPDDTGSAGAQQTAQPRSRRRFLTGVVTGGFLGSLLVGGINLYSHAQPGPGANTRATSPEQADDAPGTDATDR